MMVTVAKSLDIPIKLMFPRPGSAGDSPNVGPSHAMLGLGDVVLPGIMIGLALRFDLYLFYLRRQKRSATVNPGKEESFEKPKYYSLAGRWTDHFWSHSLTGRPLWTPTMAQNSDSEAPFTFPKTYFNAAMVGYILGLLATMGVMTIWNHAQPALLYLVPGVLGSIWLTALVRGEISLMWAYTEELEDEEPKNTDGEKKDVKNGLEANKEGLKVDGASDKSSSTNDDAHGQKTPPTGSRKSNREVFSFSIEAPWPLKKPRSTAKTSATEPVSISAKSTARAEHNWAPSTTTGFAASTEQAGKRVRLK
jgi:minor histocompatibility antigen H13